MEKQRLLSEQARLADRGAAEMVLLYISASKGMQKLSKSFGIYFRLHLVTTPCSDFLDNVNYLSS